MPVRLMTALSAGCAVGALALGGCGGRSHAVAARRVAAKGVRPPASKPSAAVVQQAEIARLVSLGYPIYCGGSRGNAVAFTFDDGPGVYTHYAVKKLTAAHQRVTFFVVGKSMDAWPGWVQREVRFAALGDHTYTHPYLPALSPSQILSQLEQTKLKIEQQSGQAVDLFRPPYGAHSPTVDAIARSLGLLEILWTVDSRDSLGANWLGIIHNVEAGLRPGAIILMHENRGQTIRALTTLLPYLAQRHMRSVTVPELLAADPPSLAQLRAGSHGCGGPVSVGGGG
jgi:peptidoglycan/xylan/chitin deacetylase (PgdA/CDA1 family)